MKNAHVERWPWLTEVITAQQVAIVVVDMQNDFCSPSGYFAEHGLDIGAALNIVPSIKALIGCARSSGSPVVFLRFIEYSAVRSEAYDRQRYRGKDDQILYCSDPWGRSIIDELRPQSQDPVIDKVRASGFFNTALDTILRCHKVTSVVLTGVATESCVLATALDATARDYYVVVISDGVASPSPERHEAALRLLSYKHPVITTQGLLDLLRKS